MGCSIGYLKEFGPGFVTLSVKFMSTFPKSTIGSQYFTLTEIKPNNENATPPTTFEGGMARIRVDSPTRGCSKTQFNLFFGKLDQLSFDSTCWWWPEVAIFSLLIQPKKEGSGSLSNSRGSLPLIFCIHVRSGPSYWGGYLPCKKYYKVMVFYM